jgi:hypothetical protein
MIGIVLPSIVLTMAMHPDHPEEPESDITTHGPTLAEESGLWLCIGENEDISTQDPWIFKTSLLLIGEKAGDEQVNRLQGDTHGYPLLKRRQSSSRKGSP